MVTIGTLNGGNITINTNGGLYQLTPETIKNIPLKNQVWVLNGTIDNETFTNEILRYDDDYSNTEDNTLTDENIYQCFRNGSICMSHFEYYENDWVWAYNGDWNYILGTGNLACELTWGMNNENLTAKRYSTIPV